MDTSFSPKSVINIQRIVTYIWKSTQSKSCRFRVSAYRLPSFFFVGHRLKLPITVAFTTSWLASLKQPCSLLIRRVKTMFLTPEMLPFSLRQLPWKCVTESTLRSLGPGLGRNKIPPSKAFSEKSTWKTIPQVPRLIPGCSPCLIHSEHFQCWL